jgi:hypothetical protein
MELSNCTFDQLREYIGIDTQLPPEIDPDGTKTPPIINKLAKLYAYLPFKNKLNEMKSVKFSDIEIRKLGLTLFDRSVSYNAGASLDVTGPDAFHYVSYELIIGGHKLEVKYEKVRGNIERIDYYIQNDRMTMTDLYAQTFHPFFNTDDSMDWLNFRAAKRVSDEIDINKQLYVRSLTPLLKALYKNFATVTYATDVEESYESIDIVNDVIEYENKRQYYAYKYDNREVNLVFKSNLSPYSYLKWEFLYVYFNEYYNISHIGVNAGNKLHMINIYDEAKIIETLENVGQRIYNVPSLLNKFNNELNNLMGAID